jgi:hypothetical protein
MGKVRGRTRGGRVSPTATSAQKKRRDNEQRGRPAIGASQSVLADPIRHQVQDLPRSFAQMLKRRRMRLPARSRASLAVHWQRQAAMMFAQILAKMGSI